MKMIAHMLLHGAVHPKTFGDFGIDLVPRPADLLLQIAPQGGEVFVEFLAITAQGVGAAHAFP